jgi:hypothetical protein
VWGWDFSGALGVGWPENKYKVYSITNPENIKLYLKKHTSSMEVKN